MRRRTPKESPAAIELDDDRASELAEMFKLMGDASRLRIIMASLGRPVSAGAIADRLGLSPSLVSHHLRLLRAARILRAERRGRNVLYGAADDHVRRVIVDMAAHVGEPLNEEV